MGVKFDGATGLLEYLGSLVTTYPHSFTFYAAKGVTGANQDIFFYGKHTGDKFERVTFADNGVNVYGSVFNPGTNASVIVSDPPLATFELYLVVFESTVSRKVYKNSTTPVVNTDAQADNVAQYNTLSLGGYDIDGGPGNFFNGHLAEFNIYAGAMSAGTFATLLSKSVLAESISGHIIGFPLRGVTDLASTDDSVTLTLIGDSDGVTTSSLPHPVTRAGSDLTAPTLTSPTGTSTGTTTASGTVITDENNGTLHYLATTNATETAATVKASGATQVISATGTKTVTISGLTAATAYRMHYVHTDAAGNDSARVSSAQFTTATAGDTTPPTLTNPTATTTGSTTASGTVSTNEANGAMYRYASTNATETVATVKAANQFSAVSATGAQSASFTGLTPATQYYAHYVHRDAAGNDSAVANSAAFTTSAAPSGPTVTWPDVLKHAQGRLPLVSVSGKVQFLSATNLSAAPLAVKTGLTTNTDGSLTPWAQAGLTSGVTVTARWISDADGAEGYAKITPV